MQASERLFWTDPLRERFEADVLACERLKGGGYRVALDRTTFYPEAGGQPADEGMLGPAEVLDVQEQEGTGVIWHNLDRALPVGERVEGSINWARRWDHMQQHTGQHLLSSVLLREFDAATRGFHLGSEEVTIDLTRELDDRQLLLAAARANALIEADRPVSTRLVRRDDPAVARARRLAPDVEQVRLVEIEGIDLVPCGGTHVPSTARIGGLHILAESGSRKHGLFRIGFICGGRLRARLIELDRVAAELCRRLTTDPGSFAERFEDLEEQNRDFKHEVESLRRALLPYRSVALLESAVPIGPIRMVMSRIDDLPPETLPALASTLTRAPDVVVLLGAEVAGAARLLFARGAGSDLPMGDLLNQVVVLLEGRGGGGDDFASGGGPRGEALDRALSEAGRRLEKMLIEQGTTGRRAGMEQ